MMLMLAWQMFVASWLPWHTLSPHSTEFHVACNRLTCSDSGVLNTLAAPYRSARPTVHRKTPPNLTSSPKAMALRKQGRVSTRHQVSRRI